MVTADQCRSRIEKIAQDIASSNGRENYTSEDIRTAKRIYSTGSQEIRERPRVINRSLPQSMFPQPSMRGYGNSVE